MAIVNTNKLEVTKLDFHGIRDSLKTFLQGQTEFNDYDFDGSGLGTILDLLSYNTHYLAFYLNMVANEMFLDTASQRSSVVGIARQLGYTPKSARGALASVNFILTSSVGASTVTVPRWTPFSVVVDKDKFLFYTLDSKTVATIGNNAAFSKIPIKEGIYVKNSWTYNSQGKKQRFILDNQYIDTTTMIVTVKASKSTAGTGSTYTLYKDLEGLDSTSEVYFLQEVEDGKYEIYFGDGIYGKALSDENVITIEYLTTNGSVANSAGNNSNEQFSLLTTINDSSGSATTASAVTIIGNSYAAGGTLPESVSTIKFNAPLSYAAQDRTVTANDYKNILLSNYGNIRGVKVWGGRPRIDMKLGGLQERSGTVYICILPKHGNFLPVATKDYVLQNVLAPYKILGIRNEIVDPNIIWLLISLEVIYNPTSTELPPAHLEKKILRSVKKYNMTDLEVFDGKYRHSVLQSVVNDADPSIVAVNRMIVKFRNKSRFDWSNVMTQEPATGSYGGSGNQFSSFKRVVFNPVEFGMSIEPSTLGGGIETNTFYVWADSLPNYVVKSKLDFIGTTEVVNEYSKADRWMNNTQLFTWSMKKVDAGGNPNLTTDIKNVVHTGKFIECYFKDDGEGRLNLYAVGEDGGTRIPYIHQQNIYENSADLSWIESQAESAGWGNIIDGYNLISSEGPDGTMVMFPNPKMLDYQSWGAVNYQIGKIGKMKPIAILGIAGDIEFFADGETPLSIAEQSMYFGRDAVSKSIRLTQKIQSLNFEGFQYLDKTETKLGGYNAAGNNIMKIDMNYLTTNISLRTTSDRPSLQVGSRAAAEEVQRSLPPAIKGKETETKKINHIGPASHTDPTYDAYASSTYVASTSSEIITEDDVIELELYDEEDPVSDSEDPIAISVAPKNYNADAFDRSGALWHITTQDSVLTNDLVYWVEMSGIDAASGYASGEAAFGTWDIRLIKAAEKPPEKKRPIKGGGKPRRIKTPDLKTVVVITESEGQNVMDNMGGTSTSGLIVDTKNPVYSGSYAGSQISSSESDSDSGGFIPDDHINKPVSPANKDGVKVVTIVPYKPTAQEIDMQYAQGYYWNPKTGEYETEETLVYKNQVIDTSTTSSTVSGETDYVTTSDSNELGFTDRSDPASMYSAAAAATMDVALDLTELKNVARDFGTTPTGTFNPADLNKDGIVDIFDLVEASKREQARQRVESDDQNRGDIGS